MKLEELATKDPNMRSLLSDLIVGLPSYKEDIKNGLPFFSEEELAKIDEEYKKQGITFQETKRILATKGMILKPATFKKYLSMGLIPGTLKIERTEKGNIGYYPSRIIRDINLLKYSLYANLSFDELLKSSINAFSMNLFAFVEMLNPESLSPLIDWEAIWDVREILDRELGKLFDNGQISREEKELIGRKAAEYADASSRFDKARKELEECLERQIVHGPHLLTELLQRG
jgi:hypothetical protein